MFHLIATMACCYVSEVHECTAYLSKITKTIIVASRGHYVSPQDGLFLSLGDGCFTTGWSVS